MRGLFVLLVAFCATLSCSSDSTKPRSVVSDDIMGLWRETTSSSILSISQTVFRPGYVGAWVDGGPDTCAFSRFEVEVAIPPTRFTGRHWRCPADSSQWSDSNMVCLELADRNHFRLQYLDVDGDGWDYVRVPIR